MKTNFTGRFVSISVADINLDGQPDLLTGDQSGRVKIFHTGAFGQWSTRDSLLVQTGSGAYAPKMGAYLHTTVADYTGDGKPDVAVGTYGGGVRLLTNILPVTITAVEPKGNSSLVVYPNPAEGFVYVRTSQPALLDVMTASGSTIRDTLPLAADTETAVSVSQWSPGVYLFRVRYADRQEVRKVLVK